MKGSVFGGSLIVAGTTIGAGMLAMPLVTAAGGFIPAAIIYLICWALMIIAGLIMLEVHMWTGERSNIITMSETFLGPVGKWSATFLYIFLFYTLCVAYNAGGGGLIADFFSLSPLVGSFLFAALLFVVLSMGVRSVDWLNRWLMLLLFISYGVFVLFGASHIEGVRLVEGDVSRAYLALPVIFTTFSFQGTVPSLADYLGGDIAKTRRAIVWGTSLALIVYLIWQMLVLGIAPKEGPGGLFEALRQGKTAVFALEHALGQGSLALFAALFAFSAMATSFLGVNLGLIDFIADGLHQKSRVLALVLAFVPPLILSALFPNLFISALSIAGGFGCVLLLGLLPVAMLISGLREGRKLRESFLKNPWLLSGVGIVLFAILLIECVAILT